jgi:hypothetical protein
MMRVSGGGARASGIGLKLNPAVHCTRLVMPGIADLKQSALELVLRFCLGG